MLTARGWKTNQKRHKNSLRQKMSGGVLSYFSRCSECTLMQTFKKKFKNLYSVHMLSPKEVVYHSFFVTDVVAKIWFNFRNAKLNFSVLVTFTVCESWYWLKRENEDRPTQSRKTCNFGMTSEPFSCWLGLGGNIILCKIKHISLSLLSFWWCKHCPFSSENLVTRIDHFWLETKADDNILFSFLNIFILQDKHIQVTRRGWKVT